MDGTKYIDKRSFKGGIRMNFKLFIEALMKFFLGIVLVGLLLFLPGTIHYYQGWLFMGLLFIPMFIAGIVLMIKNPDLLRRRLDNKEKESEQKIVILFSGIMFLSGFIVAGLNYRFQWFVLPSVVTWIGSIVFLVSYILYGEVLRENTYLSRTVRVEKDQKVIDTGMYGVIRHPMYAVTILLFLSIPFVLGCLYSFFIFLIYPFIIIKRIKNEEKVLEKELKGYHKYQKKVKYKLIPFIW